MYKVLHLSTGDVRGAFTGAYRVHKALKSLIDESVMFVADKASVDDSVVSIDKYDYFKYKIFRFLWKFIAKFFFNKIKKKEYYFLNDYIGISKGKIKRIYPENYFDFIFVYYTSNFLTAKQIYDLSNYYNAKLIFYPMDMAALTGGCHYSWGCDEYSNGCTHCPNVKSSLARYLIKKNMDHKTSYFNNNNSLVFAGSELLNNQIGKSLFSNIPVYKCLLPICEYTYTPKNREEIRNWLGLNKEKTVIYFGAQSISDPRKGISLLLEALALIAQNTEQSRLDNLLILSIGSNKPKFSFSNIDNKHLDFIADQNVFSKLYAGVDLFVNPSIEDSGPMMVNESILSGTPVIAFHTGVAIDLVENGKSGFLCDEVSVVGLEKAIAQFLNMTESEREVMRLAARNIGLRKTSVAVFQNQFINICSQFV